MYRISERFRPLRHHPWQGYAVGLGIFTAGFAARYLPGGALEAVPFITFFPSILIAALIGGLRVGVMVAVLSCLASWYFFLAPQYSWALSPGSLASLLFFWITAGIQLWVIESVNRAADRLAAERDRNAVLFRELQHRVANNMAFVVGLMRLQRRAITAGREDPAVVLEQAEKRLQNMGRVHRRLYDPKSSEEPLSVYLEALARDVIEAAGIKGIDLKVAVDDAIKLDLTRLMSLSLLINELLTNALKHAFLDGGGGVIGLRLGGSGTAIALEVSDDGKGIGAPDKTAAGSLGMSIIQSLVAQLDGRLSWPSCTVGTTARVEFPRFPGEKF